MNPARLLRHVSLASPVPTFAARLVLVLLVALAAHGVCPLAAPDASAAPQPGCREGVQPGGAVYRICMPASWNGSLVLYAHGFVAPQLPLGIPESQLEAGGVSLPQLANDLGFAFAVTSYRKNGLAILQGVEDMKELLALFTAQEGKPRRSYLLGVSEGGLVTTLAVERHPELFSGGIAACGPVGDFTAQLNYMGDVRVLFDYFYPGLIPGSQTEIPADVVNRWRSYYEPRVRQALLDDPWKREQLYATAKLPRQLSMAEEDAEAVVTLLWYNVVATADGIATLGGQPFDNRWRTYSGSLDDKKLNAQVARYSADPAAVRALTQYNTTGKPKLPLITLHTLADPTVPYWHETLYKIKAPSLPHLDYPIARGGHCNFEIAEAMWSFLLLVLQAP